MKRIIIGLLGYWIIGLVSLGFAQEQSFELDKIIVSATKMEQYQAEIGSSTTVVTAKEIQKKGEISVLEVLRDIPAVTVVQTGGFGGLTSIYLRGSKPGHTLVLIDGIEVNDPMSTDRSFNFANLTTDNIERIEVVRGPQSTLYGSDAIGGVINIITKKGRGKPKFEIISMGGSHNTFRQGVDLSGSTEKADYSISLSRLDSDGISKAVGGLEKDGYENTTLSSRLGYKLFDNGELNLLLRYTNASTDIDDGSYDDDPNHTAESKSLASKLEFNQAINSWWEHKLAFSYNDNRRKYRDDPDSVDPADNTHNWYKGNSEKFEWQHNFSPVAWDTLTFGLEYEEERGYSDGRATWNRFDRKTVENRACYLQNQLKLWENLFITPGLRLDNHQLFGRETTYKISTAYLIKPIGTRLKANWGTGFKAPSLFQLYSSYGSPNLKPDKSKGYDLGFEQNLFGDKASFGLTYFHNDFKNMVEWNSATWKYKNIGRAEIKGFEIEAKFLPIQNLAIATNFTYTNSKDKETGLQLLRRTKRQTNLDLNWRFLEKGNLNLGMTYVGRRKDTKYVGWTATRITLKDYTKFALSCSYDITKNFQLFGKIENLFDREYQEVYGYATEGRSFYAGGKVTF